jgi:drug/metabolite transporter (DMT)-like permease
MLRSAAFVQHHPLNTHMPTEQQHISGWWWALISVLVLWGLNNVAIGYSAQVLKVHYLVYTCYLFMGGALVLLTIGGRGPLIKETLRSPYTWAFSFILLGGYVITLTLFSYVSPTQGSLLQRISMIMGLAIAWRLRKRTPSLMQNLGATLVGTGILVVLTTLRLHHHFGLILLFMILDGLTMTLRMLVAEYHPPHQQAMEKQSGLRARARVVGFVLVITSALFLCILILLAFLQNLGANSVRIPMAPKMDDFLHVPTIVVGIGAGIVLLAPLRLIEFYSSNTIRSENFLAVGSLSSIATLFWERLLQPWTHIELPPISTKDSVAIILITAGSLVAARDQIKRRAALR